MVAGQTAGTTSATVTVQWAPSTGADNYTVSVTPDLPSLGGPVTTTGTSLELQDVPYNTPHTVNIVATNCAGSSAATETVINFGELFTGDVCDHVHVYIPTHTHNCHSCYL